MSLASLEREIVLELIEVTKDKTWKRKHIMQWQTSKIDESFPDEKYYFLPKLRIYVAVKK